MSARWRRPNRQRDKRKPLPLRYPPFALLVCSILLSALPAHGQGDGRKRSKPWGVCGERPVHAVTYLSRALSFLRRKQESADRQTNRLRHVIIRRGNSYGETERRSFLQWVRAGRMRHRLEYGGSSCFLILTLVLAPFLVVVSVVQAQTTKTHSVDRPYASATSACTHAGAAS